VARSEEAVARFVEQLALVLTNAGVPRMPARVFSALLATDEGKLTAAELAATLHVSPAAISGAVRYLDQVHLVTKARDPGERRDHYEVAGDVWHEAFTNQDKLFETLKQSLGAGIEAVGPDTPAGVRLDRTMRFFEFLREAYPRLMEEWRAKEQS
jgi:DNA-binding transcriptional regulator GbsR (MarR family)